jgi:hypothetical protein
MSELGHTFRLVVPAMLSLPIGMAQAALVGPTAELEHDLLGLLAGLGKARDSLNATLAANSMTLDQLANPDIDIDRLIEDLLAVEREMAETRQRQAELCAKLELDTSARAPDLLPIARRITRMLDDICVDVLETLRDQRWDAMAVRADRAPTGKPGEVIDTPEGVRAWFASLEDEA